jgi:transcriptional regulator with XRE-family HTH domain
VSEKETILKPSLIENTTTEHIAKKIKAIRKKSGLSQAEFARRLGATALLIGMIESNRAQCTYEFLERVCDVFNVSWNWFERKKECER